MFRVVLIEPEIPPNTGNIGRLCVGADAELHLVKPLGFSLDDRYMRRAGLDYWPHLTLVVHESLEDFWKAYPEAHNRGWFATKKAHRVYSSVAYQPDDFLIFGKETVGLDEAILEAHAERTINIPILGKVRSYNLSNSVAIVLFEAMRQTMPDILPGREER